MLIQTGAEAMYSTPQELAKRIRSKTGKWARVARAAEVKPE